MIKGGENAIHYKNKQNEDRCFRKNVEDDAHIRHTVKGREDVFEIFGFRKGVSAPG